MLSCFLSVPGLSPDSYILDPFVGFVSRIPAEIVILGVSEGKKWPAGSLRGGYDQRVRQSLAVSPASQVQEPVQHDYRVIPTQPQHPVTPITQQSSTAFRA